MLYRNAINFWETIHVLEYFRQGWSFFHRWSAIPVYLYHAYVLGEKPAQPGFSESKAAPVRSGIDRAWGVIETRIFCKDGEIELSKSIEQTQNDMKKPIKPANRGQAQNEVLRSEFHRNAEKAMMRAELPATLYEISQNAIRHMPTTKKLKNMACIGRRRLGIVAFCFTIS
jgi:hypothetical protein